MGHIPVVFCWFAMCLWVDLLEKQKKKMFHIKQHTMYVPTGHSLSMPMLNWVPITNTPLEEKFKYNIPLAYLLVNSPGVYGLNKRITTYQLFSN